MGEGIQRQGESYGRDLSRTNSPWLLTKILIQRRNEGPLNICHNWVKRLEGCVQSAQGDRSVSWAGPLYVGTAGSLG